MVQRDADRYRSASLSLVASGAGGAAEPAVEARLAEARAGVRAERAVVHFRAEVARVRIDDDLATVSAGLQVPSDQLLERELVGPAELDGAVDRRALRNARE